MKHKKLHEIAKFLSGLVLGDFLTLWWLASHNLLPIDFLGIRFTESIVVPGLIFDAVLFIMLVHYGWHVGKIPHVRERNYLLVSGTLFGLVALAHLIRVFADAPIFIGVWELPLWVSWLGTTVTAYLSYASFHLASRMRK